MRPILAVTLAAGLTGVLAASCAPAVQTPLERAELRPNAIRHCVYPGQVRAFRAAGDGALIVRAGEGAVYRVRAPGLCPDLERAVTLSLRPLPASSTRLCRGQDVEIFIEQPRPTMAAPCQARVEAVLTAEQIAALPPELRP
ncbi:MAG TPA: DUF6491 family protein [Brevundimonas sp.]|jgi:hypothetical protein|uniref:DUF6491 family protein n=1 Tax=Brevundimonas sp. TaxID=1871086 RepID=UPI002E121127|nr:DUF6491 family protein [Brevundimonas sp.]